MQFALHRHPRLRSETSRADRFPCLAKRLQLSVEGSLAALDPERVSFGVELLEDFVDSSESECGSEERLAEQPTSRHQVLAALLELLAVEQEHRSELLRRQAAEELAQYSLLHDGPVGRGERLRVFLASLDIESSAVGCF